MRELHNCDFCSVLICSSCCFFFFSSRRRHTRFKCDWSSDVCSSDLIIPATVANLRNLSQAATVAGIIVTNANHSRASSAYSDRFSAPVLADAQSFPDLKPARFTEAKKSTAIGGELEIIEIEGAVAGEVAIYHASNGGTLIVGDALINFEPYGFSFLPRKYCLNEKQMWSSLCELLARPAERMLFAHGVPLPSAATPRFRRLLNADPQFPMPFPGPHLQDEMPTGNSPARFLPFIPFSSTAFPLPFSLS